MKGSKNYIMTNGKTQILLMAFGIFLGIFPMLESKNLGIETGLTMSDSLGVVQGNSLLATSNPLSYNSQIRKMGVVITGYSSSPWETDDNPYLTAAGTQVREGIIANNMLPFGTKVKIPELYGDKIFVVEDRMSWKKGYYHVDIWFSSYWEALDFGSERTYIEILEG